MSKKPVTRQVASELRPQAEAKLNRRRGAKKIVPSTEFDMGRLLHELEVHQIELELQNEELIRIRAELEKEYLKFANLYDFAPVGYFTLTTDGKIQQVNLAGASLLGMESSKLIRRRLGVFVAEESLPAFDVFFNRLLTGKGKDTCELALLKRGNGLRWVRMEATCFDGGQECNVAVMDITERKQVEDALKQSEKKYRLLHESMIDGFVSVDMQGNIREFNEMYRKMLGYSDAELLQFTYIDITPEKWRAFESDILENQVLVQGYSSLYEKEYTRKDGSLLPVELRTILLRDDQGTPISMWAIVRDISERKQAEEKLRHMSTHDALTGLYNRSFFEEEVVRLERGRDFPISVIMADVDHLKGTNDMYGHAAGDELLRRAAHALTTAFRAEDVIARIGGDEFAVLLPATDADAAAVSQQRVRRVIEEYNAAQDQIPLQISLGASTAAVPAPLADVLKQADANMYREKRQHSSLNDLSAQSGVRGNSPME